jgi:hypothetical protein
MSRIAVRAQAGSSEALVCHCRIWTKYIDFKFQESVLGGAYFFISKQFANKKRAHVAMTRSQPLGGYHGKHGWTA